ncbi:MAG: hypothetical protein OXN89_06305 [Bryobacterales bacterium]|nr:hypothetical protein [Bryobacterales bacterium]
MSLGLWLACRLQSLAPPVPQQDKVQWLEWQLMAMILLGWQMPGLSAELLFRDAETRRMVLPAFERACCQGLRMWFGDADDDDDWRTP